ncbi:MAG: DNA polymerase IV [Betaproteobacteria bacterium]
MRRIIHVDMDAFYASVEQRDDPALRGLPVAVGGRPDRRGVVAAASYEARAFGVRSAMSMAKAVRLCPSLVIVPPDFARYRAASQAVFAIFREVTPLVEPLSLDEAYLDVTENAWGEPLATSVARRLKARILADTGLTASAGVAPNKFLAKIASGWKKPDGLTVIGPDRVEAFLQQLPVDALWGVGPVTARKLRARGVERLVDVRRADPQALRDTVGSLAEWLRQLADGVDDRPVVPNRATKSSGTESTYAEDLTDDDEIRREIAEMATDAARWLDRRQLRARTITIKVRYSDFSTITRSHTAAPTRDEGDLVARAVQLLAKTDAGRRPVRLLGASVHNLCEEEAPAPPSGLLPFADDGAPAAPSSPARPNCEATMLDNWDPAQYEKFQREREQPALDLVALVQPAADMRVVDLGCGTGRVTKQLHERLRARETLGIDRSARMLEAAGADLPPGLRFEQGTIEAFDAESAFDVVFSNAALHWVTDHEHLIARLARALRPDGQLAFQVPYSHDHPSHQVAEELTGEEPFLAAFSGWHRPQPVLPPETYARLLFANGFAEPRVQLVVYPHVLAGPEAVVEWMQGTLLTEYDRHLPPGVFPSFVEAYRRRLLERIEPSRPFFFPFKRILCWGRKRSARRQPGE